ncbi:glutamate racemase [bacterium]|nr:glutamate racemase [bacterium]
MDKSDKYKPIGLFDSGVGGLTVYKELKTLLPNEDYIYFGDTLNMPYGEKSEEQLTEIARKIFDFFASQQVKAVVMACNTTSAICYDKLKDDYDFKIYPVIQSVSKILSARDVKRIGVFATPATVNSHAYSKYILGKEVFEVGCPEWVKIVENNEINTPESINKIKNRIDEMMKFNPERIVLGCTHYPYLADVIGKFYPEQNLINPAKYFAQYIKDDLSESGLLGANDGGYEDIFVSAEPVKFMLSSERFYPISKLPKLLKL